MGLYGAIIVLPKTIASACTSGLSAANLAVEAMWHETDFRLAPRGVRPRQELAMTGSIVPVRRNGSKHSSPGGWPPR